MHLKEVKTRIRKIFEAADKLGFEEVESILIKSVANKLYLAGTVMAGHIYIHRERELPYFFIEKPWAEAERWPEENRFSVRKPELIPEILEKMGLAVNASTALEQEEMSHSEYVRLSRLAPDACVHPASANRILTRARMVKTPYELELIRANGKIHEKIYEAVPKVFREGMSERELQIELERRMRLNGSIGLFRTAGVGMEIFMGNIISGDNAQVPAPYDFTMGGAGDPAMPMGSVTTPIQQGTTVMVDLAGNYSVYQTDFTRTYSLGEVPEEAYAAHELSIELCRYFEREARPGVPVANIYNHALEVVKEHKLEKMFMGTRSQAKFLGHGVGIQVNEPPVLTSRSRDLFEENMVVAVEPKFVLPGIGPVGIENTYIIHADSVERLGPVEEAIVPLM